MAASPAAPAAPAAPASQDITAFFPDIKNDLTRVTWAHAVNSKALLAEALNDTTVRMLEADVILVKGEPAMGHPPATESDLTLQEFLRAVVEYNANNNATRRGTKLDFKSIEVFEKAIDTLRQTFQGVPEFPVWLNADILPGPVNSTVTPVDAKRFLDKARSVYPQLMLSLGWTTAWGSKVVDQVALAAEAVYSDKDVADMAETLKDVKQPVTYAVRAAFVAHSLPQLKSLLNDTHGNATLTVWSSDPKDMVDVKGLRSNILAIGKDRVFLDVGAELAKELDLKSSAVASLASVTTVLTALFAVLVGSL